jgi:excisionase family DNA binding protein
MESLKPTFDSDSFEPRIGRSVSIEQAAQVLGVSRRTVYNRIRDGRLQTIRTLGGSQRVLMASLEEHLKPAPDQSADKVEKEEEEGQELAAAGQ